MGLGETAFQRLQEEIIRYTTDMTVFARHPCHHDNEFCSMFANSPDQFDPDPNLKSMVIEGHFSVTNRGVLLASSTLRVIPDAMRGARPPLFLMVGYIDRDQTSHSNMSGFTCRRLPVRCTVRDGRQGLDRITETVGRYRLKPVPNHQCYIDLASDSL